MQNVFTTLMGKMPAGLKRYWAARRRTKRKGGKVMARRKRMGRRRYGRRFARGAGRGVSKMARMVGFTKNGINVGKMVAFGALAVSPFVKCFNGKSAADMLVEPTFTMNQKLMHAAACMEIVGLGTTKLVTATGSSGPTLTNKGIVGWGVLGGAGLHVAGKFVNPWLSGMPVKL